MGLGVREVGGSDRRSAGHLLTCSGLDARDQSRGDAGCGDNTVGLPEVRRLHAWHRLPPARDATSIVPPKVAEPQSTSPVSTPSELRDALRHAQPLKGQSLNLFSHRHTDEEPLQETGRSRVAGIHSCAIRSPPGRAMTCATSATQTSPSCAHCKTSASVSVPSSRASQQWRLCRRATVDVAGAWSPTGRSFNGTPGRVGGGIDIACGG